MKIFSLLVLTTLLFAGCAGGIDRPDAANLAIKYAALKYRAENPNNIAESLARFDALMEQVDSGQMLSVAKFRAGVFEAVGFAERDPADQLLISEIVASVERSIVENALDNALPLDRLVRARNALALFRETLAVTQQ